MGRDARCDLVLGGGGVKGLAHLGVLEALDDAGYEVVRAAGASAGAAIGAMAVAGVPVDQAKRLFEELDFASLVFSDLIDRLGSAKGVGSLLRRWTPRPIDPSDWIGGILAEQGVETFGDLKVPDQDDLPPTSRSRLVVRCLDIVNRRVVRLPWDYPRYGLDPDDQPVADAVRASMSIPMVYDPVPIGTGDGDRGLLIDGGLTSGFPVGVLDRQDRRPPRWPTFGVRLLPRPRQDVQLPDGELELARMVAAALLDASDLLEPLTECDERRTVRVDVSEVHALDLDGAEDHDLIGEGASAMRAFLAEFDLDAYRSQCRGADAPA